MSLTVSATLTTNIITATAEAVKRSVSATADLATVTRTEDHDYYEGETTFTPSDTVQVIPTRDLVLGDDITIEPIPSNYGRIEWNGAYLTVS